MATGLMKEQNLEKHIQKQMGCMAGFLQIFDRNQILTGKRLQSAKRLPPPPSNSVFDSTLSESEKSSPASPAIDIDSENLRSPLPAAVSELLPKSQLPLILELKEGSRSPWTFCKEAPRLSLDSRANTDAKGGFHPKDNRSTISVLPSANRGDGTATDASDGGQHNRSPSVIARLMGLEPLPDIPESESVRKPELRRSASESRVSKDLFHSRFNTDGSGYYTKQPIQSLSTIPVTEKTPTEGNFAADPRNSNLKNGDNGGFNSPSPRRIAHHRKSFFDSGDVFPEPKQTVSIYGEIEKRLKLRGIDESSKDLETLKQILEALQLKGLLHPKPFQQTQVHHQNFVYDDPPIVLLKTSNYHRMGGNDYSPSVCRNQHFGVRRNHIFAGETSPSLTPRKERNVRSPTRTSRSSSPTTPRRSNAMVKPKSLSVETTQRRGNQSPDSRKPSPNNSPKLSPKIIRNRSPGRKKSTSEIAETQQKEKITTIFITDDESTSISGSSSNDTERSKTEEPKVDSRSLLKRCDKLLHSIAEMAAIDGQPSPVSVLDPSFYKDEQLTPSPVSTKRNIIFEGQSGEEEEIWSPVMSPIQSKRLNVPGNDDFVYVADILRAYQNLPDEPDLFQLLEKQQYLKGNDTSKLSTLQRKLIVNTINEILDKNARLPPWKRCDPSLDKVWSEFQRIREHETSEDLFVVICGVLKKDMAEDTSTGWRDSAMEMSEAVLDMERLIFKDLISEAIWDLAKATTLSSSMVPRRKLVF